MANQFAVRVISEITHFESERENVQYGSWSEHEEREYKWIKKSDSEYGNLYIEREPEKDELMFLVYAVYSTGDSFGYKTGCYEEVAVLFEKSEAMELKKMLEEDAEKETNEGIVFKGQKIFTYAWKGYFEHLSGIHIAVIPYIG